MNFRLDLSRLICYMPTLSRISFSLEKETSQKASISNFVPSSKIRFTWQKTFILYQRDFHATKAELSRSVPLLNMSYPQSFHPPSLPTLFFAFLSHKANGSLFKFTGRSVAKRPSYKYRPGPLQTAPYDAKCGDICHYVPRHLRLCNFGTFTSTWSE